MFYKDVVYDIETFPNIFSCAVVDIDGNNTIVYEISNRVNQTQEFLEFLRHCAKNKLKMIGYNKYVSFECGCEGDRKVVLPAALKLLREQWEKA